jgi:hypothetical protein
MTTGVLHAEHEAVTGYVLPHPRRSFDQIVSAVAKPFGGGAKDLVAGRRHHVLGHPRMVVMFLVRRLCFPAGRPMSFPDIARRLGFIDHTTIIHGVKRVAAQLAVWLDPAAGCAKAGYRNGFKVSRDDFMSILDDLGVRAHEL